MGNPTVLRVLDRPRGFATFLRIQSLFLAYCVRNPKTVI